MDSQLLKGLNDQINKELYSAYVYLAMVAYFEEKNLTGFAHWMRVQSQEELEHAQRIFDFLCDRGEKVELRSIGAPPQGFNSPVEVFEKALEHERSVTRSIHDLYALAQKVNDYPAQVMLHWFIEEQVEEEKIVGEVLDQLRLAGENTAAILVLDRALKERKS